MRNNTNARTGDGKHPSSGRAVRVVVKVPAFYPTKGFRGLTITLLYIDRRMVDVRPFDDAEMHARASVPKQWCACDWCQATGENSQPFTLENASDYARVTIVNTR